jgi:hypothetical protein
MKKAFILIVITLLTIHILNAFPGFPKTNIMSVLVSSDMETPNLLEGIELLRNTFDEDQLIIMTQVQNFTRTGLRVGLNGNQQLLKDHQDLKNGQPILSQMHLNRFAPSPYYIQNLELNNNVISFTLLTAEGYNPPTAEFIKYFIVEKSDLPEDNHRVRYAQAEFLISSQTNYSHTISQTINAPFYKAVVVISDTEGYDIQAASTDMVQKPFRIVSQGPFSKVASRSDNPVNLGHFYIMNTNFAGSGTVELDVYLLEDSRPTQWYIDFCGDGVCIEGGHHNMTLNEGDFVEFYASVYALQVQGFAMFNMKVTSGDLDVYIPHYFSTNNLDVLIIQDDGKILDQTDPMYNALNNNGLTVGYFLPHLGEIDLSTLNNVDNIIWNVPTILPAFPNNLLDSLSNVVNNGKKLLILGQYLAQTLATNEATTYSHSGTIDFLENVLLCQYSPGHTGLSLTGTSYMQGMQINLNQSGTAAAKITPHTQAGTLFYESTDITNIRGVHNLLPQSQTIFLTFNLHNIDNLQTRRELMNRSLTWLGCVNETDKTEDIIPPAFVLIYPNPAKSQVTIEYKTSVTLPRTTPKYSVYNIKGQRVMNGNLQNDGKGYKKQIDFNQKQTPSGIYFIKIQDGTQEKVNKILILK